MAIFDTSKLYFDIDDWRTQESTVFDDAVILPWDDNMEFISRGGATVVGSAPLNAVATYNDESVQTVSYSDVKTMVRLTDVHKYGKDMVEKIVKLQSARIVGSHITRDLLTCLATSDKVTSSNSIDDAIVALGQPYYRRETTKIILPMTATKIDENGLYKGFPVIYTPYLSATTSNKPTKGIVVDLSQIFVGIYQNNGTKVLEEKYSDIGAIGFVGKYNFKVGIMSKTACALSTL